jgi:acyl-coenzyme A synthetase/AMP-(fatty) acid ligase
VLCFLVQLCWLYLLVQVVYRAKLQPKTLLITPTLFYLRQYYNNVGRGRCSVVDTYWQTETGGHIATNFPGP